MSVDVKFSSQDTAKVGGKDALAYIQLWRTVGPDFASMHELKVSRTTNKGRPVLLFNNGYNYWRRQPNGGFVRCATTPGALAGHINTRPDLRVSLTYDKWYELIMRPLTPEDVIAQP